MKTVILTLKEDVAHWVQARATEQNRSVSQYLEDLLRKQIAEEDTYEAAMNRFLSRKPSPISDSKTYPVR